MEAVVKQTLSTATLKPFGGGGGGCINEGQSYVIDDGSKIYVKYKADKGGARRMFEGESASLEVIAKTAQIRVPKPIVVADYPAGTLLVMEYLDMRNMSRATSAHLGTQLANLHLYNHNRLLKDSQDDSFVGRSDHDRGIRRFGFDVTTCCGFLPLVNEWSNDWVQFYCQRRLEPQMNMEEVKCDREAHELWGRLLREIPGLFQGVDVVPSLLHGDLWSGNIAQMTVKSTPTSASSSFSSASSPTSDTSVPVIFDPASFYGHHEFEFGIIEMFGGFDPKFFEAYHAVIPERPGQRERVLLYKLFHHLNHWNHFGSGYRGSSLSLMRKLLS